MSGARPEPGTPRAGRRRVLVTGAQRRVAGELIGQLLAEPRTELVLAVDRGPCPPELLGHDPERFRFLSVDLSRRRQVEDLFVLELFREHPLDTVVHLAFHGSPVGYGFASHQFNVSATRHLLLTALAGGVGKFVFLSSDAVYQLGPRNDSRVGEDAEVDLDPGAHPILRDIVDAEFLCRAKMDSQTCEVVVLRPSGVIGKGVVSGLNLLLESDPPILPIGFDPMINPMTVQRLARDLLLTVFVHGKGLFNVAGPEIGPLSRFLEQRGIRALRVPGPAVRALNLVQRAAGRSRYHAGFQPRRLYYGLVLDDRRFARTFRAADGSWAINDV